MTTHVKRRKARRLRFVHYRTWTFNRAVPACAPGVTPEEKAKQKKYQTTATQDKVTCPQCKQRMGWLDVED